MPDPLHVAFLGAGRMGKTHLRNLAGIPGVAVRVVADPNLQNAAEGAALVPGARTSADIEGTIRARDVDAVLITTPTGTHAELIALCVRAGKPVWCEKPVALTLEDTRRVADLVDASGVPVMIGFMRRFDPGYAAAKRKIAAGEVGRIERFRALSGDYRPPTVAYVATSGGMFLDFFVHDLDLARFLVGEVAEVSAWGSVLIDPDFAAAGDVDTAVAMLRFRNGALGVLEGTRRTTWGYDIRTEIAGSRAKLVIEAPRKTPLLTAQDLGVAEDHYESFPTASTRRIGPSWSSSSPACARARCPRRACAMRSKACAWPSPRRRAWRKAGRCASTRFNSGARETTEPHMQIASAPVSWGITEVQGLHGDLPFSQVMDEIRAAGYAGTELGPWGFYPTAPADLRRELAARGLRLVGAFVDVPIHDRDQFDVGRAMVRQVVPLLAALGAPMLILSARQTPERAAIPGRVREADGLSARQWQEAGVYLEELAGMGHDAGLAVTFHHHVGTYVETPLEIERLFAAVDPARLGLCLDTGHLVFGGGDNAAFLARYATVVRHLHLKNVDAAVLARVRAGDMNYLQAVQAGVFAPLEGGSIHIPLVLTTLQQAGYNGWAVVEQDVDLSQRRHAAPVVGATAARRFLHAAAGV